MVQNSTDIGTREENGLGSTNADKRSRERPTTKRRLLPPAEMLWGASWNRAGAMRSARRRLDLSQRDLAALLGVAPATIARAETAHQPVSLTTIEQILAAAGLRLAIVDALGHEVLPEPDDVVRNHGNRRLPAHLDAHIHDTRTRPSDQPRRPPATYRHRRHRDQHRATTGFTPARHPVTDEIAWFNLPIGLREQRLRSFYAGTSTPGDGIPAHIRHHLTHARHTHQPRPPWLDQLTTPTTPITYWTGTLHASPCCPCPHIAHAAAHQARRTRKHQLHHRSHHQATQHRTETARLRRHRASQRGSRRRAARAGRRAAGAAGAAGVVS